MATQLEQNAEDDLRLRLADLITRLVDDGQLTCTSPANGSLTFVDRMADGGQLSLRFAPAQFQHAAFDLRASFEQFSRGLLTHSELAGGVLQAVQAMASTRDQWILDFGELGNDLHEAERLWFYRRHVSR